MNSAMDFSHYQDGDAFRASLDVIVDYPKGNIRKRRNEKKFNELRAAIRQTFGVTQGVTVRVSPVDPTKLELLAGYGRVEAARLEGFDSIPVVFKVADDKEAEAIMLTENLIREELSVADEIQAAQRFVSHFDGDHGAAAAELGWTTKRLRARLAMNQCSEEVLDAVRDGSITLGHAEILSAFTEKLQNGTLTKIIAENWSLDYLKERAGKANRVLKAAIFDTADCEGCPNNSSFQAELFDNTVGKARCNNLECFREKTDVALAARKAELEDEYGIVLLAIEKPASDRTTVTAAAVGEVQFTSGCTGCAKNVVILQDGINSNCGQIEPNQCIDSTCYREKVGAYKNATTAAKEVNKPKAQTTNGSDSPKDDATKPSAKAAVSQATPAKVVAQNDAILREIGSKHFEENTHYMDALSVASIVNLGSSLNPSEKLDKLIDYIPAREFNRLVMKLYSLDAVSLAEVKKLAAFDLMSISDNGSISSTKLAAHALSLDPIGKSKAIAGWMPTKEILSAYTTSVLIQMAKDSGFSTFVNEMDGECTFTSVAKKKKGDLIDALLNSGFDWAGYAPDDYLKRLV